MTPAAAAIQFLGRLRAPEGPKAGQLLRLAPFQKRFIKGALKRGVSIGVLSMARGGGKSALSAGLALGALLGEWDRQPRREVLIAARTRDQARIAWDFAAGFSTSLTDDERRRLTFRRSPRLEIEYEDESGSHYLRALAADAKTTLGSAPTLVLMDERGHWPTDRGDELEHALMSGLGKRSGQALIISTSAPDDSHPFSRWLDAPPPGSYTQEHRPAPGLPPDDLPSLLEANPGARFGIGASPTWLLAAAERAIAQGGSALASFRLLNRNERISGEHRDLLLHLDEWLACEVDALPPRSGPVVIGLDLGGSASMSAAAYFWPSNGRLECVGWFPSSPSLLHRGQADSVSSRYCEMEDRGELRVIGDKTVPPAPWLIEVVKRVDGLQIAALVCDRYKAAEMGEAMQAAGIRCPIVWRGQGFRDGSEDVERFRRAVYDGLVKCSPSLLVRSALADAVCIMDPAGNRKLAKGRSTGRIDPAAAAVLAIAEGARMTARPAPKPAKLIFV